MKPITPLEKYTDLAKAIGIKNLYFKREDLHPYGSHKGRSIPYMIDHYTKAGDRKFVISSSGNAGLAAILHIKHVNSKQDELLELTVFVGQNVSSAKLERIKQYTDEHLKVLVKERPLQALTQAVNDGARSLRQSTDDVALAGYDSLAQEILEVGRSAAVFIGTSSGTTAQALADSFSKKNSDNQVHIIQTSSCHPMVDSFETYDGPDETSIADAIVDNVAHRKAALTEAIMKAGGRGWAVTNDDIVAAEEIVYSTTGLNIGPNSALSIAGLKKAAELGYDMPDTAICIICGA